MMYSPPLKNLPNAPPEKKGWPWIPEISQLKSSLSNARLWPKISIVTPSFNQVQFLEETIRSVLLQGYPNLEYIIIDGGSTDGSIDIIKKYSRWLRYWVSEPDSGQSNAINKGFAKASGEIFGYLNSDDLYEPNALKIISSYFMNNSACNLLAGECTVFDDHGIRRVFQPWWPERLDHLLKPFGSTFGQPASFWKRDAHFEVRGFDESLHFCFDREFFLKIGLAGHRPHLIFKNIARYRQHKNTKTNQTIRFHEEAIPVIKKYALDCKITKERKDALIRQSQYEICYLRVFIVWKNKGRLAAFKNFVRMVTKSPKLLLKRKNLGLLRRLLYFRPENVIELGNV